MDLTLTGDLLATILSTSKKDTQLVSSVARKYLEAVDPVSVARYLLTKDVAIDLLAQKLAKDPAGTIRALQGMPPAAAGARGGRRAAGSTRRAAGSTQGARPAKAKRGRPAKRKRLSAAQSAALKQQVVAFLSKHPWATRKQLTAVVPLNTQAVYRRIMHELQDEGKIVGKGRKSKAVYALKGARKGGRKA